MAERVVLHIGSMKSGTSFIQNVLGDNKDELAEHGCALSRASAGSSRSRAVQDLIGARWPGPGADRSAPDPWQSARRRGERVARHRRDLDGVPRPPQRRTRSPRSQESFPDAELEVVLTGRDLARNIPAMWLESVQNGSIDRLGGLPRRGAHRGPRLTGRAQLLAPPGDPGDRPPLGDRVWRGPLHPGDRAAEGRAAGPAVGAVRAGSSAWHPTASTSTSAPTRRSAWPPPWCCGSSTALRRRGRHPAAALRPATSSTSWPSAGWCSRQGERAPARSRRGVGAQARRAAGRSCCAARASRGRRPRRAAARGRCPACTPTRSASSDQLDGRRRRARAPGASLVALGPACMRRRVRRPRGRRREALQTAAGVVRRTRGSIPPPRAEGELPSLAVITMARDEGHDAAAVGRPLRRARSARSTSW